MIRWSVPLAGAKVKQRRRATDRHAAEDFCRAVYPRLVGSLSLVTGDPELSEDLAQEALSRVWDQWPRVREMEAPEAWTYRTAMNLRVSWFRRRSAEHRALVRLATTAQSVTADSAVDALALRDEVTRLPPRQRMAIVLRYYAGLSESEAAMVMRCASGTVKAHVHKALVALRQRGLLDEAEVQ